MSDPSLPAAKEKEEKERKGAGAFWSSSVSKGASSPWRLASEGARGFLRSLTGPNGPVGLLRHLQSLGWRGAFAVLKVPLAQIAAAGFVSYCMAQVLAFGIARAFPHQSHSGRAKGAVFGAPPGAKASGSGWLPTDGLFGLLPGVFTTSKGFRKDGSPVPNASVLKEGKGADGAEGVAGATGAGGASAGAGGADGAASGKGADEVSRWAEALQGARGGPGAASARLERVGGLGADSFSSGAVGSGPGAKGGGGKPGGKGPTGPAGAASGRLTAFGRGAPKRELVAGSRIARALPPSINARQALLGTQIVSNAAARIAGNEASAVHAGAPFDTNSVGAQVVGDPVGLRGGGPGGGPRPNPSGRNGGLPFSVNTGNPNILRPDLGTFADTTPDPDRNDDVFKISTYTVNPNADATIFIQLIERARALTTQSKDNYNSGIAKIAAGASMVAAGWVIVANAGWTGGLAAAAGYAMIAEGINLGQEGVRDLLSSNDEANEAMDVADQIESQYNQTAGAEAIDYCVEQARQGNQCVFRGNETRSQQCGYKPKMTTDELTVYSICMAESGPGLTAQTSFYPDGRPDPADPDRICRIVYPDAVLRQTGNANRPYICVRTGNTPPP